MTFRDTVIKSANAARAAGQTISINWDIPTVAVDRGDCIYFFQEHEASQLLDEADNNRDDSSVEDYLLWSAQSW